MSESTALGPSFVSEPTELGTSSSSEQSNSVLLPPSKGNWIQKEVQNFQKSMMTDIAMLLNYHGDIDLVETSCSYDSLLTKVAQLHGMTTERWKIDDYDLSTESGLAKAEQRLRSIRPRRLWLSPEHGPVVPEQWRSCMRLAWVQLELGGYFYIEQPQTCVTWNLKDTLTRQLLDRLSSSCIRDLCFDDLKHPRSGKPLQRSTRIQSNDPSFI